MNLNKVFIAGRMTAKPLLRNTPGGAAVTSFGVATNHAWTDKNNQKQEEVEFHNIVAWGKTAELACQCLDKGQEVLIEGRLKTREWDDKQNVKHRTTEIIADRVQFGQKAKGATDSPAPEQVSPEEVPVVDLDVESGAGGSDFPL